MLLTHLMPALLTFCIIGPFTDLDPDKVMEELDEFWRVFYKKAKSFGADTQMHRICENVKIEIQGFRKHSTLIQVY